MPSLKREWREFRLLARSSSYRLLDNELLSPGEDMSQAAANVLGLLAAFGMGLSLLLLYKYVFGVGSVHYFFVEPITWPDKQYLIAASMLASGFMVVMTWDALFPDRRDAMVLCPLPLRMGTLFAARVVAMAGMLACVVLAANAASFIAFPTYMMSTEKPEIGWLHYFFIHLRTIFAASAFAFLALLALEGLLINILPYRLFQRASAWVQLTALFSLLFLFVLEPNVTPGFLSDPANARLVRLLPPAWFLGLYQEALGSDQRIVLELAALAKNATLAAAALAVLMYGLGYRRAARKAIEESDAVPASGSGRRRITAAFLDRVAAPGMPGAVFRFVALTMLRHRRNRLILAAYLSLGLGYALGDVAQLVRSGSRQLFAPGAGLAALSLVLLFFTLLGMRVLFAIPVDLTANWIFRVTEAGRFPAYQAAVRRVMLWVGAVPLCAFALPAYGMLWGWRCAALHVLVLLLLSLLLIEILLRGFAKIPFTCSFLPGGAQLKTRLPVWAILFSTVTFLLTHLEIFMLRRPGAFLFWYGAGCLWLVLLSRGRRQFEREQYGIVYEDRGEVVLRLGLQA